MQYIYLGMLLLFAKSDGFCRIGPLSSQLKKMMPAQQDDLMRWEESTNISDIKIFSSLLKKIFFTENVGFVKVLKLAS